VDLSRRELLAASALLLARPGRALAIAPAGSGPIILCWNENPYGPSPAARAAVSESIASACRYPDDDIEALTEALAAKEGFSADHIVTGTGSGELLCALGFIHGHDGGEIIAAEPTYVELTDYARNAGAHVRFVRVDKQLRHDLNAMHAAVSERTRAIYLCNPNNPTGTAVPAAAIRAFVDSLPERVTTIVDEAYMDFTDAPHPAKDLLPGMYAEIRFRSHRDTPPLLVPGDTLIADNSGMQVAVLEDAGDAKKIHMQSVRIGRDFGTETEIISGLAGTETIVVNPGDDVREGALVKADGSGAQKASSQTTGAQKTDAPKGASKQ